LCYTEEGEPTESGREGKFEQLTRAEDEEYSVAVVQRSKVTAIILTNGLQVMDDVIDRFLNAYHFIRACLKFMHKMEAVIAQYEEIYTDIQNEARLLKTTSFYSTSSVSRHRRPFAFRSLLSVRITDVISANTNPIFFCRGYL
jgi:hypothetical protein